MSGSGFRSGFAARRNDVLQAQVRYHQIRSRHYNCRPSIATTKSLLTSIDGLIQIVTA
jgi:hypothetical protein